MKPFQIFNRKINKPAILVITISVFIINVINATDSKMEKLLAEQKYEQAHAYIMSVLGGSAEQNYYKGLLLYHMNKDLDNAIIYLTKALQNGGPERTKLILGLVMHKLYRFDEAIRILNEYVANTRDNEGKGTAIETIKYCENGNSVAHRGRVVTMKHIQKTTMNNLSVAINQNESNIIIIPKPQNLYSKTDTKVADNNLLMVLPKDVSNLRYVYYSAYEPGKSTQSDIYRVQVLENGEFAVPENLGNEINTFMDEISPFFDQEKQALYFASKGHQSFGGFDIFVSFYNSGAESWSKPMNIGFPINSSCDDYFFIPLQQSGDYFFVTNRNIPDNEVQLVAANIPPGARYKSYISDIDKVNVAKIEIKEPENGEKFALLIDKKVMESKEGPPKPIIEESPDEFTDNDFQVNEFVDVAPQQPKMDTEYQQLVNDALHYQVRADSVNRRINEQYEKIKISFSETRKQQMTNELKEMQTEYNRLKSIADNKYMLVKNYEIGHGMAEEESPVVQKTEINDIKVYEYKNENTVQKINNSTGMVTEPPVFKEPGIRIENNPPPPPKETKPVFDVENVSPNKEFSKPAKLETSDDLPSCVVYTIQVGVYSRLVDKSNFHGLNDVFYFFIPDRKLYKYYTGVYKDIGQAVNDMGSVKSSGFKDAFVAAFYQNKPVSLEKATQMMQND